MYLLIQLFQLIQIQKLQYTVNVSVNLLEMDRKQFLSIGFLLLKKHMQNFMAAMSLYMEDQ